MDDRGTLKLRTLIGPQSGSYNVRAGESAVIGRLPFSDICLLHEGVSRRHALVSAKGTDWFIADQGSSGGTYVNGIKLRNGEPSLLSEGDLVRVGPWTMRASIASEQGDGPRALGHQPVGKTIAIPGHPARS